MSDLRIIAISVFLTIPAVATAQQATSKAVPGQPVWAYQSSANYCPAGLQPVSNGDAICCGVPNQKVTYQVATRSHGGAQRASTMVCPVGEKGCHSR